jgi:hypothetical protein
MQEGDIYSHIFHRLALNYEHISFNTDYNRITGDKKVSGKGKMNDYPKSVKTAKIQMKRIKRYFPKIRSSSESHPG